MTDIVSNITRSLSLSLLGSCLIAAAAVRGSAQSMPPPSSTSPPSQERETDKDDRSRDFGNPEAEMRAKLLIKADKKDYEENVARAREVSDLACQVMQSYEGGKTLTTEDSKKLVRLEKLTKRIRNEAGGSDSEAEVKDLPDNKDDAVKRIATFAEELKKLVEKTPRHVVSAAVIDQANKILGAVQFMRDRAR